jgi:hypothetical protein
MEVDIQALALSAFVLQTVVGLCFLVLTWMEEGVSWDMVWQCFVLLVTRIGEAVPLGLSYKTGEVSRLPMIVIVIALMWNMYMEVRPKPMTDDTAANRCTRDDSTTFCTSLSRDTSLPHCFSVSIYSL